MLELLPVGRVSSFTVLLSNMTGRNIRNQGVYQHVLCRRSWKMCLFCENV